ncbi:hypothetical protein ACLB2K_020487 [Fragaria x ananassa]
MPPKPARPRDPRAAPSMLDVDNYMVLAVRSQSTGLLKASGYPRHLQLSHNPTSGGHKTNSNGSAVPASSSIKWLPPPCNLVKLNFDGSICHNKKTATGFVVRDHEGNPILAGSRCVGNSSVPIAKCSALRDGLFHALCNDIRRVQVEGDSKLIIDLINNTSPSLETSYSS